MGSSASQKHDHILREAFRQLADIQASRDSSKVERLLEVREYATRHIGRIAHREHDKGTLRAAIGIFPAAGIAVVEGLRGLPSPRELAFAPVAFVASMGLGLLATIKPHIDMNRAARDKKIFQRIIDSEVAAVLHEDPALAMKSPRFCRRFDLGQRFKVISSKDEAPARLRARLDVQATIRPKI